MKTLVCPTCGCSLVRLGISKDKATTRSHDGEEYRFCCQACADLFNTEPEKYLQETSGLVVCSTCLAEKPPTMPSSQGMPGRTSTFAAARIV